MFKKGYWLFVLTLLAVQVKAQSIRISAMETGHSGSYVLSNEYIKSQPPCYVSIHKSSVVFENTRLTINHFVTYGISPDHTVFGFLKAVDGKDQAFIVETPGNKLQSLTSVSFEPNDPSLKIYPLNDGKVLIRSNIAHFDIYNEQGNLINSVSNATGSSEGETISQVAVGPFSNFVLLYNPKIYFKHSVQSRIQKLNVHTGAITTFYYNESKAIKNIAFSKDGQFVYVTLKGGGRSEVVVLDQFGNVIRTLKFHFVIDQATMSNDRYITIRYKNQIEVYNLLTGRNIGSSYLRAYLMYASYVPKDHMIIGLAGDYSYNTDKVSNIKIFGVDLRKRKIGQGEYHGLVYWKKDNFPLNIDRLGARHYKLTGFSRNLSLKLEPNF